MAQDARGQGEHWRIRRRPAKALTPEQRREIAEAMRALRERIRARTGNIPDIDELIDAGWDDV